MRLRTLAKLVLFLAAVAVLYVVARLIVPVPVKRFEAGVRDWWSSPEVQSRVHGWDGLEEGGIRLQFQELPEDKAQALLELLVASKQELAATFGVKFPAQVRAYVLRDASQNVYYETDGAERIVLNMPRDEDWMPLGMGGTRNHVALVAHQMSLWANCFEKTAPEYPETEFGSALATFLAWNFVVPAIARKSGELAWPIPYKYYQTVSPERYAELAGSPPEARTQDHDWGPLDAFWSRALQKHGPGPLAASLQEACALLGDHTIEELARRMEEQTGDPETSAELLRAAQGLPPAPPRVPPSR